MTSPEKICRVAAVAFLIAASCTVVLAAPFTASYTDGNSWNTLYGQGFNAFVNDGLSEPIEFGAPVPLSRFEFFKSGNADTAANIQLAIIAPFYASIQGLTTTSPALIGLSTNTVASTAGIATGEPIRFNFDELQLNFGDYYGAVFVNVDGLGNVTPVLVSAIHADYVAANPESPTPTFVPETNYDVNPPANLADYLNASTPIDYNTSTSNFLTMNEFGTYYFGFSYGADANFTAYFDFDFPEGTPGDFDGDGDVDGRDFLEWQRGDSPTPLSATDLADWQNNYGTSGLAGFGAVPEPHSLAIGALGSLLVMAFKRSQAGI
jgi:hypothetical protein